MTRIVCGACRDVIGDGGHCACTKPAEGRSLPDQGVSPAVVYIAKCAEHGIHGERDECYDCRKPVDHVGFVRADLYLEIRGRLDRRIHDLDQSWKARGRELNEIYDALTAVVQESAPGFDPVADLKALGAERDRLRAEREQLRELDRRHDAFVRDLAAAFQQHGVHPLLPWDEAIDSLAIERDRLRVERDGFDEQCRGFAQAAEETGTELVRLRAENELYRTVIKTALDRMGAANDEQMGPGGVARKAYAGLWHAYFAIPAGIETPPASDEEKAT